MHVGWTSSLIEELRHGVRAENGKMWILVWMSDCEKRIYVLECEEAAGAVY